MLEVDELKVGRHTIREWAYYGPALVPKALTWKDRDFFWANESNAGKCSEL